MKSSKGIALSIMPIILLFGYTLSNILWIKLPFLILIGFVLLIGYIFFSLKYYSNNVITLFFLFFLWVTFLLFMGNAIHKFDVYMNFIAAIFMIVGIYYYALYSNIFYLKYFICAFIFLSFIIALLEVKFNVILPGSVKNINSFYNTSFKNIPISTFYNPNDFATAIGMLFIYIYSYCKLLKDRLRYLVLICCFFIIYFAGSRGIQLSIMLFPFFYSLVNKRPIKMLIILYSLLIITFYYLFINKMFSLYNMSKYSSAIDVIMSRQLNTSFSIRLQIIVYTFNNIGKLLIGFGPGGSSIFLGQFSIPNPHNFFLEILIDYGIIGITLVLSIFGLSLKINYNILKKDISYALKASCKATIILFYLYIFFSIVPSSLLNYWPYAWLPIYLTLINMGAYKKVKMINNVNMGEVL
jgi:hypothetical protein